MRPAELEKLPLRNSLQAAWRVDVPKYRLANALVDHLYLVLDADFPLSEPRVVAPQAVARGAPVWPHVEKGGVLCLSTTRFSEDAGRRALTVLQDAFDVLDLDEPSRLAEFDREFISYWSQHVPKSGNDGLALLRADPTDRDIYFHVRGRRVLFTDTEQELESWLKNSGVDTKGPFPSTRLVWPLALNHPDVYPKTGRDLIELVGAEQLHGKLPLGGEFPVVLGKMVDASAVFVAAVLKGPSQDFLRKGFRPGRNRPQHQLVDSFRAQPIKSITIERIDAGWVHGRDANAALPRMQGATVGIIGCGAIGGFIARGLMQAGVGQLRLVDHDDLKAANLGRHVLGAEWIGERKASALATQLARDFPHSRRPVAHTIKLQELTPAQRAELAQCDVIVLAGVDLQAELDMDRWTETLDHPPPRVWTWTEEFAHAGHAVALFDGSRLQEGLDADGRFRARATTNWDANITTKGEAACGVSFQPYDAMDMMHTVLMAQRLTTDIILQRTAAAEHRAWFGDRAAVLALGAQPSADFDRSFTEKSSPWVP